MQIHIQSYIHSWKSMIPATVFINPGDIGTRLTWDQVREMHKMVSLFLTMVSNM